MKALPLLTDPVYVAPATYNRYETFWLKYINDKRDILFIRLLTHIHLAVIPLAVLLFTPVFTRCLVVGCHVGLFLFIANKNAGAFWADAA